MSGTSTRSIAKADEDAIRTLALRRAFAGAIPGTALPSQGFGGLYANLAETPFILHATVDPSYDLSGAWYQLYGPVFSTEQTTFGVLNKPVGIAAYPTQPDVMHALEEVRQQLDLTAEDAARLIGVGARSYLGYKSGDSAMPLGRMQTALNAAMALGCLAAGRWEATRRVLTTAPDSPDLVATGQFISLRGLVDRAQADIDREREALAPALVPAPSLPAGLDPNTVLAAIQSAEFQSLVPYLEAFAPGIRVVGAVSKAATLLELEGAVERLYAGDPLGSDYLFLSSMKAAEIDALLRRARELLRTTTPDAGWQDFIEAEAAAAWGRYSLELAEPVEDSRETDDEPAYQVLDVADLGFDLATGRAYGAR